MIRKEQLNIHQHDMNKMKRNILEKTSFEVYFEILFWPMSYLIIERRSLSPTLLPTTSRQAKSWFVINKSSQGPAYTIIHIVKYLISCMGATQSMLKTHSTLSPQASCFRCSWLAPIQLIIYLQVELLNRKRNHYFGYFSSDVYSLTFLPRGDVTNHIFCV